MNLIVVLCAAIVTHGSLNITLSVGWIRERRRVGRKEHGSTLNNLAIQAGLVIYTALMVTWQKILSEFWPCLWDFKWATFLASQRKKIDPLLYRPTTFVSRAGHPPLPPRVKPSTRLAPAPIRSSLSISSNFSSRALQSKKNIIEY